MTFAPRNPQEPTFEEYEQTVELATEQFKPILRSFVRNLFAEMRWETAKAAFAKPVGKAMTAALEKHVEAYRVAVGLPNDCPVVIDRILDRITAKNLPDDLIVVANVEIETIIRRIPEENESDEFIELAFKYQESVPEFANNRKFIDVIKQLYRNSRSEPFVLLERELLLLDRCYRFLESLTVNQGTKVGA
ncbi:hypothetical protein CD351_05300 [Erythrobacter sp. KY5]|uniref:hypothetical protein n=1 Tax=Erythrobacter sp. KY5 TaxID=2011159 RepID=UPI000DBF0886|nr:hypothetical protein [Erythrobacter sp. KY5]AWW73840.1 hypothetical protein CD351_05300 [Erythrobacter sp. KY5]